MDLIGYTMDLESLISRYTFLIFTEIVPIILVLFLTWFFPYLKKRTKKTHNKHKTKRKVKLEKEAKRNTLISQIFVSVLLIVVGTLFIKSDVTTLNNLKKDLYQNSVIVYEGDAYLWDSYAFLHADVFFDLIVDSRFVDFANSEDTYQIDVSKIWKGRSEYSGEFYGKITYGENSKFILKIE